MRYLAAAVVPYLVAFLVSFLFAVTLMAAPAQAQYDPDCIVSYGMRGPVCVERDQARGVPQTRHFGVYTQVPKFASKAQPRRQPSRLSLAGYPAPLVAKVRELETRCGARLVSAFRPGAKVRGSGRPSLHASKQAVDMAGNQRCIYARMKGWPGGYSTDYSRVAHIHISYAPGGREWGARFSHWRPRRTGVGG